MTSDVVLVFADVSKEYAPFRRFFFDLLFLEKKAFHFFETKGNANPAKQRHIP